MKIAPLGVESCTMEENVTKTRQKPFEDREGKEGAEIKLNKIQQEPRADQIFLVICKYKQKAPNIS